MCFRGSRCHGTTALDNLPNLACSAARTRVNHICSLSVFIDILPGHLLVWFELTVSPTLLDLCLYALWSCSFLFAYRSKSNTPFELCKNPPGEFSARCTDTLVHVPVNDRMPTPVGKHLIRAAALVCHVGPCIHPVREHIFKEISQRA